MNYEKLRNYINQYVEVTYGMPAEPRPCRICGKLTGIYENSFGVTNIGVVVNDKALPLGAWLVDVTLLPPPANPPIPAPDTCDECWKAGYDIGKTTPFQGLNGNWHVKIERD